MWQFDTPEQVFVGRAVDLLGKLLFSGNWPDDLSLLRGSQHFNDVSSAIREHCAFGRLIAYFQRVDGSFEPVLPHYWNTREFQNWISVGKIPFETTGRISGWHPLAKIPDDGWLFIGRSELEKLVEGAFGDRERKNHSGVPYAAAPSYEMMENFYIFEVKQLWIDRDKDQQYAVSQDDFLELVEWRFGAPCDREQGRKAIRENKPEGWIVQGNRKRLPIDTIKEILKPYKNQQLAEMQISAE